MQLRFEHLTIKHFGAVDHVELNLKDLDYGVHFVCGVNKVEPQLGSNGAGKTTLWNAMTWCLFGTTLVGSKNPHVKPWGSRVGVPDVEVVVTRGDREHIVRRRAATNGLTLDGKLCEQRVIDELLGLTFETWAHTIVFGQGRPLFFDLQPAKKMEVLSEVLNLDKWSARSQYAKRWSTEIMGNIQNDTIRLKSIRDNLTTAIAQIADLRDKLSRWEQSQADDADQRDKQIRALEKQLDRVQKDWDAADLAYDSAETELRAARKERDELTCQVLEQTNNASKYSFNAKTAQDECATLEDELKKLVDKGACPMCGSQMSKAHVKKHRDDYGVKIRALEKQIKVCKHREQTALDKATHTKHRLAVAKKAVQSFLDKSNDAIDARTRAESKLMELKAQIASLKKQQSEQSNPYSELLAQARKQKKQIESDIADKEKVLRVNERKHSRVKYWIDGFKHLRLYLLQEVLDELTAMTQSMLPAIGLDGWSVQYAMERENKKGDTSVGLNVTILKPDLAKAVRWESWSGGEGQRLRIVGAIALSQVLLRRAGIECDLLILDEPTRHLSREGVRDVVDYLIDLGRDRQVFYCDHTAIENARFASTITVTRSHKGVTLDVA